MLRKYYLNTIIVLQKIRQLKANRLIWLLAIVATISGCKKWLDEKPSTRVATPESIEALQSLMDNKYTFSVSRTPSMLEAAADDYFLISNDYDYLAQTYKYIAPYLWQADPFNIDNDWKDGYLPIYVTNLCLEQIQKIPRTNLNSTAWDNIKGSALFYRAYYFLWLCWNYSNTFDKSSSSTDLGIALRLASDINLPSIRANVLDSYNRVLKDAKESVSYLPEVPIHCLRPSKVSAWGLLARAYLSMREYDSAMKFADLAWSAKHDLMNFNNDFDILTNLPGEEVPIRQYNKETIFYSEMNYNHFTAFPKYGKIDSNLLEKYNVNDLRKNVFFKPVGAYKSFKGTYCQTTAYMFSGIATDEILLMRAECKARVGGANKQPDKFGAINDLNTLLRSRWKTNEFKPIDASVLSEGQALDTILLERRKELLMRGLRWMDIKRLNKEGRNIELVRQVNNQLYKLPPNDKRYALPLPQEILDLTGMPQNPR